MVAPFFPLSVLNMGNEVDSLKFSSHLIFPKEIILVTYLGLDVAFAPLPSSEQVVGALPGPTRSPGGAGAAGLRPAAKSAGACGAAAGAAGGATPGRGPATTSNEGRGLLRPP